MSAIDSEDLNVLRGNAPYPAGNFACLAVSQPRNRAVEIHKPGFAYGE
jgi:hypothetical protein